MDGHENGMLKDNPISSVFYEPILLVDFTLPNYVLHLSLGKKNP